METRSSSHSAALISHSAPVGAAGRRGHSYAGAPPSRSLPSFVPRGRVRGESEGERGVTGVRRTDAVLTLTGVEVMPGFAYGLRHPSLIAELAVATEVNRERPAEVECALSESIRDEPVGAVKPHPPSGLGGGGRAIATLLYWLDRLRRAAAAGGWGPRHRTRQDPRREREGRLRRGRDPDALRIAPGDRGRPRAAIRLIAATNQRPRDPRPPGPTQPPLGG